ncbi:unnamed protein product [Onchocerca ochengi]|uniref:Uncharacterized protein n=1 Tax=Onchocerca ochengi TaxID=42157 RepID=A0A182EPX5_ONCOC|nr:unnamed protein product [Onchocerca ochengi]
MLGNVFCHQLRVRQLREVVIPHIFTKRYFSLTKGNSRSSVEMLEDELLYGHTFPAPPEVSSSEFGISIGKAKMKCQALTLRLFRAANRWLKLLIAPKS